MRLTGGRLATIAFVVAVFAMPLVAPQFWVTLGNYIGLYSIVALGLVLLTGVAGQTSFGQAAFVGLGAYTTAYLTTRYGTSPWLTLAGGTRDHAGRRAVRSASSRCACRATTCRSRRLPGASACSSCSATSSCSAATPA